MYLIYCHTGGEWTPHKVEMAVWTFYVLREFKPEVLEDLPGEHDTDTRVAAAAAVVNGEVSNGSADTEPAPAPEETTPPAPAPATECVESNGDTTSAVSHSEQAEVGHLLYSTETSSNLLIFITDLLHAILGRTVDH